MTTAITMTMTNKTPPTVPSTISPVLLLDFSESLAKFPFRIVPENKQI